MIFWFSCMAIAGFALSTFAATAVITLNEVAWHDLEEYCKQRKRPELFSRIFDQRKQLSLGANIFQMLSAGVGAVGLIGLLIGNRDLIELKFSESIAVLTLMALSFVVTGSWIPWAIAALGSTQFLARTWRWWWLVSSLAWPLMIVGQLVSKVFQRASGQDETEEDEEEAFEDEILSMVSEGEHDGFLQADAREMIEGVMELHDQDVAMVMTPRSKVDALEISTSWQQAVERVVDSGRTRIPIYDKKLDRIVGLLYAKDLLRESLRSEAKRKPLKKLLRVPLFVPETKNLSAMLKDFLRGRTHMAIVQDEYGGVAGVVTIEDVLEEIVGEIEDETDNARAVDIKVLESGVAEVSGSVHVSRLNQEFGLDLPEDEDFDTLAGLILHELNEIPRPGRTLSLPQFELQILSANRRQVQMVRIEIKDESASD